MMMFTRCLIASMCLVVIVQAVIAKGQVTAQPLSLTNGLDLTKPKTSVEGSGVSLDDYADEDIEDQLVKITATTTTTTTTTKAAQSTKTTTRPVGEDDFDANEFKEDYADDLEDETFSHDTTSPTTLAPVRLSSTVKHPSHQYIPLRVLFGFLTRPPIAAGILVGLAIGILISVVLLVFMAQRFRRRQQSHSSFTTGLLYPNQYGYSKTPQEFYA